MSSIQPAPVHDTTARRLLPPPAPDSKWRQWAAKPAGLIVWRGTSLLDGRTPVAVILTGMKRGSTNSKTGAMLQTWIVRDDVRPTEALKTGEVDGICGDCIHGPSKLGSCYVKVFHGPNNAWDIMKGRRRTAWPSQPWYAMATPEHLDALRALQPVIRFGSYGDPAAVPTAVWAALADVAVRFTGYTHAWRYCDPALSAYCMASIDGDDPVGYAMARAEGWRTFRVRRPDAPTIKGEVVCPASEEAGYRVQCADCTLCMGATVKARPIVIMAHGAVAKRFKPEGGDDT